MFSVSVVRTVAPVSAQSTLTHELYAYCHSETGHTARRYDGAAFDQCDIVRRRSVLDSDLCDNPDDSTLTQLNTSLFLIN